MRQSAHESNRMAQGANPLIEMEEGPDESGPSSFAGEGDGLAAMLPAADRLQANPFESEFALPAGATLWYLNEKRPEQVGPFFFLLAERTGLADMLPAADSLASESLRVRIRIARRGNALVSQRKKARTSRTFFLFAGGADGTRTRDPRRDRPVF